MGVAMLSKSLIQFSVDGHGCVLSLLFGLRPNYGRANGGNGDLLHCVFRAPDHAAGHTRPTSSGESLEHSQGGLAQSLVGTLLLPPGSWCAKVCVVPSKSLFPSPVKLCNQVPRAFRIKFSGFSVALLDSQVGKSVVSSRTFFTVGEFPCYNTRDNSIHGHHQMVNTKIRLIIFCSQNGEALYSQQKQDQELTVAQIVNSLLPNSDLDWRK